MNKKNTIPLETAQEWAKEWRNTEATYNKYHECKAFNIPKADLQEVLNEKGVESVRAYIGVQKTEVNGKVVFEEKLMIVGVNKITKENPCGEDMITLSPDGKTLDPDGGSIFDFTSPCPSMCDNGSPLNG